MSKKDFCRCKRDVLFSFKKILVSRKMALLTTLPALVSPFSFCSHIIFLETTFEAEVALRLSTDISLFKRGETISKERRRDIKGHKMSY